MSENTLTKSEQTTSDSERFTSKVLTEYNTFTAGDLEISKYQRNLIQRYFIRIEAALKAAEENRIRKNNSNYDKKYNEDLPVTWGNVNLNKLALDVMNYSKMGLDMMMENHIFPIPFKNNKLNQYDINLMLGYAGKQFIAEKYAVEKPKSVTTELVYSTDTFIPIKKSIHNAVENYEFGINNVFDRGDIVGGFGYLEYDDNTKNKLVIMTKKDFEKRKPKKASVEFWGGEKDTKAGKEVVDGWFEEMCMKTLKREVFSSKHIPRDPQKIDDSFQHLLSNEAHIEAVDAQNDISENANKDVIDVETSSVTTDGVVETPNTETPKEDVFVPNF